MVWLGWCEQGSISPEIWPGPAVHSDCGLPPMLTRCLALVSDISCQFVLRFASFGHFTFYVMDFVGRWLGGLHMPAFPLLCWFGPRRNVAGPGFWLFFPSSGACAAYCLGAWKASTSHGCLYHGFIRQVAVLHNPNPNPSNYSSAPNAVCGFCRDSTTHSSLCRQSSPEGRATACHGTPRDQTGPLWK